MTRRMKETELRPPIVAAALERADNYPDGQCLVCGKSARTFTSRDVPELRDFIGGKVSARELERAARALLPGGGCLLAHLSGVSICATAEVVR